MFFEYNERSGIFLLFLISFNLINIFRYYVVYHLYNIVSIKFMFLLTRIHIPTRIELKNNRSSQVIINEYIKQ